MLLRSGTSGFPLLSKVALLGGRSVDAALLVRSLFCCSDLRQRASFATARVKAPSIPMMGSSEAPLPSAISSAAFSHLLSVYPTVQNSVYAAKVKDPERLTASFKNHDWRYEGLPAILAELKLSSKPVSLGKEEMLRLTQWKIVHGAHRPFLPGMVRKNEPARVEEITRSAFTAQSSVDYKETSNDIPQGLDKALREAALLHGIGPATATLVCSIYDPVNVPFFEDELIAWMCPDIPKVKYTWAEYKRLFAEVSKLRQRLGLDFKAVDVEKVGFVIGHLHELDMTQREEFTKMMSVKDATMKRPAPSSPPEKPADKKAPNAAKAKAGKEKSKPTKKRKSLAPDASPQEQSKPLLKRSKK